MVHSAESPAAMPRMMRPGARSLSPTSPAAVTEGCRVTGLVTAVKMRARDVLRAQQVVDTNISRRKTGESGTPIMSKPASSHARHHRRASSSDHRCGW